MKSKSKIILIHPGMFETARHLVKLGAMLESLGYSPQVHSCWGKSTDTKLAVSHISHSGGFTCPIYQKSELAKFNFAPTTASPLRIVAEIPLKTAKDLIMGYTKFGLKKLRT